MKKASKRLSVYSSLGLLIFCLVGTKEKAVVKPKKKTEALMEKLFCLRSFPPHFFFGLEKSNFLPFLLHDYDDYFVSALLLI